VKFRYHTRQQERNRACLAYRSRASLAIRTLVNWLILTNFLVEKTACGRARGTTLRRPQAEVPTMDAIKSPTRVGDRAGGREVISAARGVNRRPSISGYFARLAWCWSTTSDSSQASLRLALSVLKQFALQVSRALDTRYSAPQRWQMPTVDPFWR